MNDFIPAIVISLYSPYYQLALMGILFTAIMFFSRLSETMVIKSGIQICGIWLFVNFTLSLFADSYWYYLLHWLLSAIALFAYWYLTIYLCGRFGSPYTGDGGMVMLLPVYLLPVVLAASAEVKVVIFLLRSF